MMTAITKMFTDIGISLSDETARYYLDLERKQLITAFHDGRNDDGDMEPLDYYHANYGSNTHAPPDDEMD